MKTRIRTLITLAASATLLGCAGPEQVQHPARRAPVTAQVEQLANTSVSEIYEAVGTVRSRTTSTLSSKVLGQVLAVHVEESDRVEQGQLLVEIDARDSLAQKEIAKAGRLQSDSALVEVEQAILAARSAQAAAEANQAVAASTYQRFEALLERQSISRQEFDEAEARRKAADAETERAKSVLASLLAKKEQVSAQRQQAEAELGRADIYLSYSRVEAPFSGRVIRKFVEPGDMAVPGVPLLTVEDDLRYRLEAAVDESYLGFVRKGQTVEIEVDALEGEVEGVVSEIGGQAEPATRSFVIRINLPAQTSVRSGMFGRARFPTGRKEVLTAPLAAVVERGQLVGVYVIDDQSRARFRLVKTGRPFGDRVEILSGLKEGERIVVGALDQVGDGTPIRAS